MARVKRGVTAHAKHKKVYKAAKGFYGRRKNTIRAAKAAVEKAGQYAFRDRKRKKRTFRALWIQRLNAAVRPFGMTYSVFINALQKKSPQDDRVPRMAELGLPDEAGIDPFNGKPLIIKKFPKGWAVYSVGRNLVDDGGNWRNGLDEGYGPELPKVEPEKKVSARD